MRLQADETALDSKLERIRRRRKRSSKSLPSRSGPDFDSIEQACAKPEALLRTAAARTVPDLWTAIRNAFTRFKPDECRDDLAAAGYDPTRMAAAPSGLADGGARGRRTFLFPLRGGF